MSTDETLRGRGTLVLPDRTYNVEYELSGNGGRITALSPGDLASAILPDESVRLVLEDGRWVAIIVENHNGGFRMAGGPPESKGK